MQFTAFSSCECVRVFVLVHFATGGWLDIHEHCNHIALVHCIYGPQQQSADLAGETHNVEYIKKNPAMFGFNKNRMFDNIISQ